MMILYKDIKNRLKIELEQAAAIWIATAMISDGGWEFMQNNIPKEAEQNFLIGIDLATSPNVFESILGNLDINARIYQSENTFHPKVYIIKKSNSELVAFIGSSNATKGGLENNVEMNFIVTDQEECEKLIRWFKNMFQKGYLITDKFVSDYKLKYKNNGNNIKEIAKNISLIKEYIALDQKQFFNRNQHEIFNEKYHYINTNNLKKIRKEVHDKFRELHFRIYPKFKEYGLLELHCHHNSRQIVSRHYFNAYSGNYINSMWLHYGKSYEELQKYEDQESSFINNIRIQVIIHKDSLGVWLLLGKNGGSVKDREYFRKQMQNEQIQEEFYNWFKKLGKQYWIKSSNLKSAKAENILSYQQLTNIVKEETLSDYFIIGRDINFLDDKLSDKNIALTVLGEIQKLYPLYNIMRHK